MTNQQHIVVPAGKAGAAYVEEYLVDRGYPKVGSFAPTDEGKKALKKFYSYVPTEFLDLWLDTEGLTYKPTGNEQIDRMRRCMAILELHYPKESKGASAGKGKYSAYTDEVLVAMAAEHNVPVEICEDSRILRMRVIMALRAHGHLA